MTILQASDISDKQFTQTQKGVEDSTPDRNASVRLASLFLRLFSLRTRLIGFEQINEPGWNMLLDLYVNEERGRRTSVSSLGIASGAPQTTSLRQIHLMQQLGFILLEPDPLDRRCRCVRLSVTTKNSLDRYLRIASERIETQFRGS